MLSKGFQDITSAERKSKSLRLKHPSMARHVSLKLSRELDKPMLSAPLVLHPDDASRLRSAALVGIVVSDSPFLGASTKYQEYGAKKVAGFDVSVADLAAVGRLVTCLIAKP